MGVGFSAPVETGPGAHPASFTRGTGSFPGVKGGRGVTLTPHLLLVPWSRKSRAIPLLPLWAVRPVQSFSACTRVHFNFFYLSGVQCWFRGHFAQWEIRWRLLLCVRCQVAAGLRLHGTVRNPLQHNCEVEYLIKLRKLLRKLICVSRSKVCQKEREGTWSWRRFVLSICQQQITQRCAVIFAVEWWCRNCKILCEF